jgi:LDH2 family malate/lactate/ureidoglycolate dehydrogenase
MGDHEGYALALIVDLLSGVTSSAKNGVHFAGHLAEYCRHPHNVGGLFAAVSVDSFMDVEQFRGRADQSLRELKKSPRDPGVHRIHAPGEIEHETRLRRSHEGIPLPAEVVGDFQALASELGIHFPEAM